MRYVIAMIFAIGFAAATTIYVSDGVATWFVNQPWVVKAFNFDNPDTVSDVNGAAYMAVNLLGLLAGWAFGWVLGGSIVGKSDDA